MAENGVFRLNSESTVTELDLAQRRDIAAQLERLPREAFGRLEYLQPQIGCLNACTFCSQDAAGQYGRCLLWGCGICWEQ